MKFNNGYSHPSKLESRFKHVFITSIEQDAFTHILAGEIERENIVSRQKLLLHDDAINFQKNSLNVNTANLN